MDTNKIQNLNLNSVDKNNKENFYLTGKKLAQKLGLKSNRFQKEEMSEKAYKQINEVKQKHISNYKLEDWQQYDYFNKINMQDIYQKFSDNIKRLNIEDIKDIEEFQKEYEGKGQPVIIKGCEKYFNIDKYWTWDQLYKRYKNGKLKVGEDDKGRKLRVKLKYYLEYMIYQKDDRPLYLFESALESQEIVKKMLKKYEIPPIFQSDNFDLFKEKERPPHRWFLIGPVRSGSTVHQDPLNTTAWNISLQGHKLWILMSQKYPKSMMKCKQYQQVENQITSGKKIDDEALIYFHSYYEKLKNNYGLKLEDNDFKEKYGIIECIQKPGETIVVPGGVWHAVLNLDNTMAITQNYCSNINFKDVWIDMRKSRPKLSHRFINLLSKYRQKQYQQAIQLNYNDKFVMYNEGKQFVEDLKRGTVQKEYKFLEDKSELGRIKNKELCGFKYQKHVYSDYDDNSSSSSSSSDQDSSSSDSSSSYNTRSRSRSKK